MNKCPYCNHNTSGDEKQCSNCGENLEIQCPYCKEYISVNDKICPFCSSKLKTNSISIIIKITYVLLFINAFIPYWFANSIQNHPVFWHSMVEKNKDILDLVSFFVSITTISVIPSIIGIVANYRKRVCTISIIAFIIFCIFNIYLVMRIN